MQAGKEKVSVIGTGVIGASWCTLFAAHGYEVWAYDPDPAAEARLHNIMARQGPALQRLGLTAPAGAGSVHFTTDLSACLQGASFVQENGPEKLDLKIALFRQMEDLLPRDSLIASSSSGLAISPIQAACRTGDRMVTGHPFNPPHLIPLVEVVGGNAPEITIERVMAFYTSLGKKPIRLRQELPGHIANRLQAALWREAMSLVARGVCSAAEIDRAVSDGIGLRWALLGPFMNLELSGGEGGIAHNLTHMGPAIESWWQDLGQPQLDAGLIADLQVQMRQARGNNTIAQTDSAREKGLIALLAMKGEA